MVGQDRSSNLYQAFKTVTKFFLFPLLAVCKIVNSGAQTSSGLTYSINYCMHKVSLPGSSPYQNADPLTLALSSIALVANLELTSVTRITALQKLILDDLPTVNQSFQLADFYSEHRLTYGTAFFFSTLSSLGSGSFTTINSWLFGRTLTEFGFMLGGVAPDDSEWKDTINTVGLIVSAFQASGSATSFYSYNILKIQTNAKKMATKIINEDWRWKNLDEKTRRNVLKTGAFTLLNIFSTATFAYFSTKKSIPRFIADLFRGASLDESTIILIAALSIITTITTGAFTTTPAVYKWMSRDKNAYNHFSDQSRFFRVLRILTLYFFGLIDSASTGLGNFRGGADLFHDLLRLEHYSFGSIALSSICAVTGAFSNMIFNVNEGFEDYRSYRIQRIESLRALLAVEIRGNELAAAGPDVLLDIELTPLLQVISKKDEESEDSNDEEQKHQGPFSESKASSDFLTLDLSCLKDNDGSKAPLADKDEPSSPQAFSSKTASPLSLPEGLYSYSKHATLFPAPRCGSPASPLRLSLAAANLHLDPIKFRS